MARNTKLVSIDDEGSRDNTKSFLLTEMSATQGEKFAAKAFLALASSGVEIPDDVAAQGMAGLLSVGMKAFGMMKWEFLEPLLDEMFRCVQIVVPAFPVGRPLKEEDIEEIQTRFKLRTEWVELEFGFFKAAGLLTSRSAAEMEDPTSSTQTSAQ
jgi:hypothetical protein